MHRVYTFRTLRRESESFVAIQGGLSTLASNTEFLLIQRSPLCSAFWNSSKGPFISGEIPLGRLDPGWSLERDEALSLWGGSTDSKTLDNQRTNPQFSSVQFSRSVMSNSLRPHESQHTRLPCPSPTPGVYSNSCPLSW